MVTTKCVVRQLTTGDTVNRTISPAAITPSAIWAQTAQPWAHACVPSSAARKVVIATTTRNATTGPTSIFQWGACA